MEVSGAVRLALDPSAAKPAAPPDDAPDTLARVFFALALALAGLRFFRLGAWSLWLDEALTLADAGRGGGLNPLGYWVFEHIYALFPGRPDELGMRLPAAVCGFLTVLLTPRVLRPFVGRRAAAFAAFFVASSAWHLYWAQNARFYTLAQLLALLGGGALLGGLFQGRTGRAFLGLLLLVLSALTHPSAAFWVAPLLCVPWAARWMDWIPPEAARARVWTLFSYAGLAALMFGSGWALRALMKWDARQGAGDPLHFAKTVGYLATPTLGLAFLIGAWRRRADPRAFALVWSTVLGLGAAGFASFFVRVSAQYVFVLQPWMAACAGLALLPGRAAVAAGRVRPAVLALLVALPGLVETGLYFTMRHGDRPSWREAYAYVYEHRGPYDLVLGMDAPVAEYYLAPDSTALRAWTELTYLDDFRSRLPMDWARYGRRAWFVLNRTQLDDWGATGFTGENRAAFERLLREDCTLVRRYPVPYTPRDLDVEVWVTRDVEAPRPP